MLYERWRQTAREWRNEIALTDAKSGVRWTFQRLLDASEVGGLPGSSGIVYPQGASVEFVLSVVRGWKSGATLCPLDEGQSPMPLGKLPQGCAHLKSTSASTGHARWIAFTAEQLAADVDQIVATMELRRDWPNLGVISLAHSYGFSNLILPLLLHGIPLILPEAPLPESLRLAASSAGDITLPAVPALWRTWLDAGAVPANVRLAISAGAPLPIALESEVYERCGLKIHNFYGASECGGIAFDKTSVPRVDAGCAGSALKGVELTLDENGLLNIQSASVGLTYWPDPSPVLERGCYRSSDLAEIKQGSVFLRGRLTDQINVAGRKVSPETIEEALSTHPGVIAALVFGTPCPDSDRSEMIVACIATKASTTTESLKQHLLGILPAWQIPRDWWFVPRLEANRRGKVTRAEWRQRYLNGK